MRELLLAVSRIMILGLVGFIIAQIGISGEFGRRAISRYMDWEPTDCYRPSRPYMSAYDVDSYNWAVNEFNSYLSQMQSYVDCVQAEAESDLGSVRVAIHNGLEEAQNDAMSEVSSVRAELESARVWIR